MNNHQLSHSLDDLSPDDTARAHSGQAILELLRHMTGMARDDENLAMAVILDDALAKCTALQLMERRIPLSKRN